MNKEELIKYNAVLNEKLESQIAYDIDIRKEFAKAFNWTEKESATAYSSKSNYENPSWEQIFTKLGRLLEKENGLDFQQLTSSIVGRIQNLENELMKDREC